jgi:predicted permease
LRNQDPGFVTENVISAQLTFTPSPEGIQRLLRISDPLVERLGGMPGVRAAAASTFPVISEGWESEIVSLPERPAREGEKVHVNHVTAGFFETYGIQVLRGRPLGTADTASAPRVAVINERLARQYFGGEDPIGRRYSPGPVFDAQKAWQVVGIVRNTKYHDLREEMPAQMYVPVSQGRAPGLFVGVRAGPGGRASADLIRQALREVDPSTEIESVTALAAHVEATLHQERMLARLGGLFSLLALALAWTGVYGTMSYAVARRTREIGVRAALGAAPGTIQLAILRDALRPVAAGILAGVPLALAAARVIRGLLYGVEPGNPLTLALTLLTVVAAAVAAAWLPARAASRVDPLEALRSE